MLWAISTPNIVFPEPVFRLINTSRLFLSLAHARSASLCPPQRSFGVPSRLGRLANTSKGSAGGGLALSGGMLEKLICFCAPDGHLLAAAADRIQTTECVVVQPN